MYTPGALGAAALSLRYADRLVLDTVRDVHGSVAGRVHTLVDAAARHRTSAHVVHDAVSAGVYTGVGAALRAGAHGLGAADRALHRAGRGGPRLEETPRGRFAQAAVNGLVGDRLRDEAPEHFFDCAVRRRGRDVPLEPEALAAAYPGRTGRIAVFVHGLCENEDYWRRTRRPRPREVAPEPTPEACRPSGTYADTVREAGWTPVMLRVNTGLPVRENGAALAALLERLVVAWPGRLDRIALVGHSMGGLLLRAACAVTTDHPTPWRDRVTDVVTLGTPHLGAPLERLAASGAGVLGRLPESAPFGRILDLRSAGIVDLGSGLPPDVQRLPHARYRLVAATLTRSRRNPVSETVGDLLVPYSSAVGRPRRGGRPMFPGASVLQVPRADHFDLLNHDEVHAALRRWLGDGPASRPPPESCAVGEHAPAGSGKGAGPV